MQENKTQTAFPSVEYNADGTIYHSSTGMTKHEYGAFMIAQGLVAKYKLTTPEDQDIIAEISYQLAETILRRFR